MKKCPVCKNEIKRFPLNIQLPLHNTIKCSFCGRLLRKKFSIWFIPIVLFMLVSLVLSTLHWAFYILALISIIVYLVFMYKLPYVPYDK